MCKVKSTGAFIVETRGVQNPDVCFEHVSLYIQFARNDERGEFYLGQSNVPFHSERN
jgi:hypothetical protein